jgi:succinate dehydrogenase/fumarate reductase flavoprotein subunit
MNLLKKIEKQTDVLVIGGGFAGVFAALRARSKGLKVIQVDKGDIGRSGQTPWVDSFHVFDEEKGHSKEHYKEIVKYKGLGVSNTGFLDMVLEDSKGIYEELKAWGATGNPRFGKILKNKVIEAGVETITRTMITELVKDDASGRVIGAAGFMLDEESTMVIIEAKCVINCAGAGSYKAHGFPVQGLTFDGDAISYKIGAEITGKEYNDFHCTFTKNTGSAWYQWGSKWGIGLYEESTLMEHFEPKDGIDLYKDVKEGKLPIFFKPPNALVGEEGVKFGELPEVPEGIIPQNSPEVMKNDITYKQPVALGGATAGMSIHKAEGVFPKNGEVTFSSCVEGLYAAGDALGSMLVGCTYSALGISSAGSCVQGSRAGIEAGDYCETIERIEITEEKKKQLTNYAFCPLLRDQGYDPGWVIKQFQNLMMPFYVIYVKEEKRLVNTIETLGYIRDQLVPKILANDTHELKLAHEASNMVLNAEMKLRSSLFRTETRGSHFREDYPETDDKNWQAWTVIKRDSHGGMGIRKVVSK